MFFSVPEGANMAEKMIWRLPDVTYNTGLGRSSIYRKTADGEFPKPIKLGPRAVGWISDEVLQWIQIQIDASRSGDREPVGPKS
jgi:prophage regulatory protein